MSNVTPITVVHGDGIGPEITAATLQILKEAGAAVSQSKVIRLLERVAAAGFDFTKTENLCTYDGKAGYSLGQGE